MSTSIQDCRKPPNGGGCIRDDDFDAINREQQTSATIMHRFQERVTSEFLGVFGAISRVETKVDRLLEGYEIGNVRPAMQSLDYGEGEDTAVQDRPVVVARMKSAERAAVSLEEENAALRATLEERQRQSDRAIAMAERRWSKWQKIGAGILALIASLGGGTLLAKLLGG